MIKIKGKFFRKVVSLLLVLSICLPMGDMIFADDTVNIITEYYKNPMYEGLDIDLEYDDGSSSYSEDEIRVFDSLEDASDYMRDKMVKREGSIEFKVNTSYYEGIHKDIYDIAVDENNANNPNEGDYINAHFSGYRVQMSYSSAYVVFRYDINYLTSYEEELLVDKKVNEVLDELNVYDSSEYIKIKSIHDYIVTNIDYDYSLQNHSAYNAIVEESVVCQGFASLTYRMLRELGVGVRYINGYGNGGRHAWNIAKIGDKWYNLDNTWDENISSETISYKYFLKSMSEFEDHERDSKFTTSEFNSSYPMASESYTKLTNEKPIIVANDIFIKIGEKFNELEVVSATDKEDGNITNKVKLVESTVDQDKVGKYKVTYEVQDSDENKETKTINVIVNFQDTPSSYWAYKEIMSFAQNGYISDTNIEFRPGEPINRAEFVKIVNKAFGFTKKSTENFSDVNTGDWYYDEVCIAINAGYIDSKQLNFRPESPIKREEVASIITSIKKCKDNNLDKIKNYIDCNDISDWALSSVEGAIESGYMGVGSTAFRPKENITRAEAVVTLNRIIK